MTTMHAVLALLGLVSCSAFCPGMSGLSMYSRTGISSARQHLSRNTKAVGRVAKGRVSTSSIVQPQMVVTTPTNEGPTMTVLREGIKAVGVGVKGSKPIPDELVDPLAQVSRRNPISIFLPSHRS